MKPGLLPTLFGIALLSLAMGASAQEALFEIAGPPDMVNLPEHAVAGQVVRVNRRALQSPRMSIELFGETYFATRTHIDRRTAGQTVWTGYLEGSPLDSVVVVVRGNTASGFIQRGFETYRIGAGPANESRLYLLDLRQLPPEDLGGLPDGGGATAQSEPLAPGDTVQDLLVVYNQAACTSADASGECAQLEADIVAAVADANAAYAASGIDITLNLVGTHKTVYAGTGASQALSHLAGLADGYMDEVHAVRDSLGADIVSLVYDGDGCGIGYLNSSSSTAFNVTDEPCLVGNRTMAHEIGHNQGAHHDRQTVGGGAPGGYNYGYRRCNDGSVDDFGSPYFRTVLSYSCTSAPRVGRFSNPNVNYSGVPQGVDPAADPDRGAWNAKRLNERAATVAAFRDSAATEPPAAPGGLSALAGGHAFIDLAWSDLSTDESAFVVQHSTDGIGWSDIASLAANTEAFTHTGLSPESTHHYRVRAENGAGSSGYSNTASETTDPLPSSIEDVATGDIAIQGTVSGSYVATQNPGGGVETITETHTGGSKKSRKQAYRHAWSFDVFGGAGGVVVSVDAWVSGSEGANFYYSLDGGASRSLMFTVDNTSPTGPQMFTLPAGASGAVRIEVQDAAQTTGEPVDSVTVDHIVITSHTIAGDPPATPSDAAVTGTTPSSVTVEFSDNSEDEFGFELWRAIADPSGNCEAGSVVETLEPNAGMGPVAHTDNSAAPESTYWYWVRSFNGAGDNGDCSNAAAGTTPAGSDISLSVGGYKVRGEKIADLTWSGAASVNVDVYRDGSVIATTANDGAYTDNTGQTGGGTLTYTVCEEGSLTLCSDPAIAAF
jgi:hypothetical protein